MDCVLWCVRLTMSPSFRLCWCVREIIVVLCIFSCGILFLTFNFVVIFIESILFLCDTFRYHRLIFSFVKHSLWVLNLLMPELINLDISALVTNKYHNTILATYHTRAFPLFIIHPFVVHLIPRFILVISGSESFTKSSSDPLRAFCFCKCSSSSMQCWDMPDYPGAHIRLF